MRLRVEQTRNGRWIVMELQASGKWMPTHYIYPTREEAEAFIASCK